MAIVRTRPWEEPYDSFKVEGQVLGKSKINKTESTGHKWRHKGLPAFKKQQAKTEGLCPGLRAGDCIHTIEWATDHQPRQDTRTPHSLSDTQGFSHSPVTVVSIIVTSHWTPIQNMWVYSQCFEHQKKRISEDVPLKSPQSEIISCIISYVCKFYLCWWLISV